MNNRIVYIKSVGWFVAWMIIWFIVGGVLSLIPMGLLVDIPDGWFALLMLVLAILVPLGAYYMAQRAAYGRLNVLVMHDGISIIWEKSFLFHRKPEQKILFDDLAGVEHSRLGYLVLKLKDGSRMTMRWRLPMIGTATGFSDLVDDLSTALPQYDKLNMPKVAPALPNEPLETQHIAGTIYKVKNTSALAGLIIFFTIMFLLFLFAIVCVIANANLYVIIIALLLLIWGVVYLFRKRIPQRMEVQVLEDRIAVQYTYKPFFDRVADREILIDDIASYRVTSYNGFFFTLYLKNGTRFKAGAGDFDDSSELEKMCDAIIALMDRNNASLEKKIPIVRRKTIYEGTSGLVLAVFLAVCVVAMLIGIIFFPNLHNTSDVVRGVGVIVTALGMLFYIISLRRRKDQHLRI